MNTRLKDTRSYRGMLQSDDGRIVAVLSHDDHQITFQSDFGLSQHMIERLRSHPGHILFSERSRIARLGVQITCEPPTVDHLNGDRLVLTQTATAVIPGYPGLKRLSPFFGPGLPVGRLVFCDPEALLTSEEVLAAIERADLKLPASTAISSDGSIVIAPHRVICSLREDIDNATFGRILLREDGREMLNRYQVPRNVAHLILPPGQGVITTCSMYLNEHYVVLQSGFSLGRNLPATVLDPIKTRGIRIYLEIINGTRHTIANPLISARIYGTPKQKTGERRKAVARRPQELSADDLKTLQRRLASERKCTCHFIDRSLAIVAPTEGIAAARIFTNGPPTRCDVSQAQCAAMRNDFTARSRCPHLYATAHLSEAIDGGAAVLVLKYFPNLAEHREIVNLAAADKIKAIYFLEASCEHGPFLSQEDHSRLQEYNAFGVAVYWLCSLNQRLMVHTIRDGKGYFVALERLADFHKSMLFAFYGSTLPLSQNAMDLLGRLMDALVAFWGRNIGIVTGGGSGVMEAANTMARRRGILSGANFLDITDQAMNPDVDFCQVFQSTCRHSRQKWFEIASFPIFNVGGLGSLEELGITLCNMKLSIMERVPIILFDTEGRRAFWAGMRQQIATMVQYGRAPAWIADYVVITDDPQDVIDVYRKQLQLF
ncbi:LOG family protein [Desulfatitalea alkaliphila]|uniref:AMP nucleosidase n=1 Tax=Desulfatitalea alkaliphila TaxID=2929485 RepID=A0AA41R355_9BACT|nr:LOG family protein [Desulfatitalea alkaliphila]MCJ8502054.1 LOG family protein [Desulfatitalea alkaliphila]